MVIIWEETAGLYLPNQEHHTSKEAVLVTLFWPVRVYDLHHFLSFDGICCFVMPKVGLWELLLLVETCTVCWFPVGWARSLHSVTSWWCMLRTLGLLCYPPCVLGPECWALWWVFLWKECCDMNEYKVRFFCLSYVAVYAVSVLWSYLWELDKQKQLW